MKEANKHYVDTSRVTIREIGKSTAKKMIVKYHYSHAWTMCRYALGVFYETDEKDVLGNTETLIGCLVYGYPVGRSAIKSVIDGLEKDECLELTRLFIHDGYGSNIESFAMGQSFKWMKDNASNIKMLLSYADPEQMHLGGIYQATNWLYQDCRDIQLMPNYSISIESDPHKWIHSRTVFSRWGSHNLDHLKTQLGKENLTEFWRKNPNIFFKEVRLFFVTFFFIFSTLGFITYLNYTDKLSPIDNHNSVLNFFFILNFLQKFLYLL